MSIESLMSETFEQRIVPGSPALLEIPPMTSRCWWVIISKKFANVIEFILNNSQPIILNKKFLHLLVWQNDNKKTVHSYLSMPDKTQKNEKKNTL